METLIDPWGGVHNMIASVQNGTHYGYPSVQALEAIVNHQLAFDSGYVAEIAFVLLGKTIFPNGVIDGPMAVMQLQIEPVFVCPANRADAAFANLTQNEAITLAQEAVSVYQTALSIDLERLMMIESQEHFYFNLSLAPGVDCYGKGYWLTYVGLFMNEEGSAVTSAFRQRLAALGGFMNLVGAPKWPDLATIAAEGYMSCYSLPDYDSRGSVVDMLLKHVRPLIRSAHPDLEGRVQSVIAGVAAFNKLNQVMPGPGEESYSLKSDVGYSSAIMNKMQQDITAAAVSMVGAEAPGHLTVDGLPSSWLSVDNEFPNPTNISLPGGFVIPANMSVAETVLMLLGSIPKQLALDLNSQIGTIQADTLDQLLEDIWGGGGFPLDLKALLLALDYSTLTSPVIDINYDTLAAIMRRAGLTPDTLIDLIDPSVAEESPVGAIAEAFVKYFDSYRILDILEADHYTSPSETLGYLNPFIQGLEQALHDIGNIDMPSEARTKEGLAAFVEKHWDIVLGALWSTMAGGNLTAIQGSLHAILNVTNLQEHITPYLMVDLGSPLIAGTGFVFATNYESSTGQFTGMSADDLRTVFDLDLQRLAFDGPYLIVAKHTDSGSLLLGQNANFTIEVHNFGNETAYDIKVLDGVSSGFDGQRPYYWTKDALALGESWVINYTVRANDTGLFLDMPAICIYFNTTLSSFDPAHPSNWTGTARYTFSEFGHEIRIEGQSGWQAWPVEYSIVVLGCAAALALVICLARRRPHS